MPEYKTIVVSKGVSRRCVKVMQGLLMADIFYVLAKQIQAAAVVKKAAVLRKEFERLCTRMALAVPLMTTAGHVYVISLVSNIWRL